MYYTLKDNKIEMCAKFKFSDDCLYTDKNIIRGYDGVLVFEDTLNTSEYQTGLSQHNQEVEKTQKINENKEKLEELNKDLLQVQAGLVIPNIEEKKQEFRTLLNEIRVLEGKAEREEAD